MITKNRSPLYLASARPPVFAEYLYVCTLPDSAAPTAQHPSPDKATAAQVLDDSHVRTNVQVVRK